MSDSCDPKDCSLPGSFVHEISWQEHWSGLPYPSPEDLHLGIKPASAELAGGFFITEPPRKPKRGITRDIITIHILEHEKWREGHQYKWHTFWIYCVIFSENVIVVHSVSRIWFCSPMDSSTPGFPVLHHLLEPAQPHVHQVGEAIQPSHPLSSPLLLLSLVPSIRVFSNESALPIRWPQYWSFSFSINPSNGYLGLISFKSNWVDLAVQRTLKSLLQHHSSKASILWCSAFFIVQLSHPHMSTGKTIAFTIQTFVGKVMSLLFNMLSRLVVTFLPRSKCLSISWPQSPSAVILEPKKISLSLFPLFHSYLSWSDGTRCHDLRFVNIEF